MKESRLICSHEKSCGCVKTPKKRQGKEMIVVADSVVNPAMNRCGDFIQGRSDTKYCCLTRQIVHIIK